MRDTARYNVSYAQIERSRKPSRYHDGIRSLPKRRNRAERDHPKQQRNKNQKTPNVGLEPTTTRLRVLRSAD